MILLDHLFIFVLAIVHPVAGYISFNRLVRRAAAGEQIDRARIYLETLVGHWLLFGLALALWFSQQRSWNDLGFNMTMDNGIIIGALLTVAAIVLLIMQVRQVADTDVEELRGLQKQLGKLEMLFPRNGNELGRFYSVALTAGIVEETLWRGFMIWYFSLFFPIWAAALISAVGFGLAHAYQGIENLPKVTVVGIVFTGLYLLTGSLWLPMILHAAVDILQGRMVYDALRRVDNDTPSGGNVAVEASAL